MQCPTAHHWKFHAMPTCLLPRTLLGKGSCIIRISACMLFTTRPAFPSLTSSLKAGLIWGSCTCLLSKGVPGRGDALWYCHGAAKGNVILHRGFKT